MSSILDEFYEDLKKVRPGRLTVFLGAGASFDFGIPTMNELAGLLLEELKNEKSKWFSKDSVRILEAILGNIKKKEQTEWNIEDLLTRLYQIKEACSQKSTFPMIETKVGEEIFDADKITEVEESLLKLISECFGLKGHQFTKRKSNNLGKVQYLSDFIKFMGRFQNPIKIFTTNTDICIEAAIVRLSQETLNLNTKNFQLIDGFGNGLIPTFSMDNYAIETKLNSQRIPVCYWKLHGSIDWVYTGSIESKTNDKYSDDAIICKKINDKLWQELSNSEAIEKDVLKKTNRIMIFPTPAKYLQTYSFPYMDLYEAFRRTLQETDFLLVIGTTFPDSHINSAIKSFLKRDTHMYVIDPKINKTDVIQKLGNFPSFKPIINQEFSGFISEILNFTD